MVGRDVVQLSVMMLGLAGAGAQPYISRSSYGDSTTASSLDSSASYRSSYYGDDTMDSIDDDTTTTDDDAYTTANGCIISWIADGGCDHQNNNPFCFYDGGDCCECTCVSTEYIDCGYDNDFDCLSPSGDNCDLISGTSHQSDTTAITTSDISTGLSSSSDTYDSETSSGCVLSWIGDGECDRKNNIPLCEYDGGDCCKCTCVTSRHTCGYTGFDCIDSSVVDGVHDCEGQTEIIPFCSPGIRQEWLVEDSTQALALAEAVNCFDGEFNVKWRGRVVVQQTIHVGSGTILNITGDGSGATLDGIGTTGLFSVVNASLVVSDIIFSNGSAVFGGAIAASGSNLTLHQTSYIGNHAVYNGGAIFTRRASTVTFDGETLFANNGAGAANLSGYGGGLFASEDSIVSLSGPTTFADNHAGLGGGALFVGERTHLAWDGLTAFFANDGGKTGGALVVRSDSIVLWSGNTQYMNNSATSGGALSLSMYSNVYWSGDTLFKGNRGSIEGGALYVEEGSRASWDETTSFLQNTAQTGGAVLLTGGSHVGWSGATSFINNTADADGGAVGTRAFTSTASSFNSEVSFLAIKGVTNFASNKCSRNGGALALMGTLVLSVQGENITFSGNSAGFGGGAVSISSIGIGPVFSGTTFLFNKALFGGGVHATGSGIEVTTEERISRENPVSFVGCLFQGNTASSSGGAVNSASGKDLFMHSSFVSNSARVGGALRVSGGTSVDNCSFVDNSSDLGDGPAVSNVGSLDQLDDSSFSRNFINCEQGTYLAFEQSGDILSALCDGCTECNRCTFGEATKIPTCSTIPRHSKSPNGATTIEELKIDEGYWRAKNTSTAIFECPQRDACLGGVTGASGYCRKGHTGPYCSVCSPNYTGGLGFTCDECSGSARGITVTAVVSVVVVLALMMIVVYLFSEKATSGTSGIVDPISRCGPLQSLKIIIVAWQILTQFCSVTNVTFPDVYQTFLDGVGALNFDITWVIATSCVFAIDFHDRLLILTITPLVVVLFLGATYGVGVKMHRRSQQALEIIWQKHLSMVLLVTFLVYSSVSSIVFQTFSCELLDDGISYLRADYGIDCDSTKHGLFKVYAGLMIAVYPFGIPAFYAILLVRNRELLRDEALRGQASSTKPTSNLWKPYRSSLFYYEVLECCRRVSLTGVVVFIYPNTAAQIALSLLVAFTCSIVSEILSPYLSVWDAWLNRIAQVTVFLSMYLALLMKVDVSGEGVDSQRMFEVMLVAAHAFMILVVVVEALVLTHSLRTQTKAEQEPQPIRSNSVTSILEVDEPL